MAELEVGDRVKINIPELPKHKLNGMIGKINCRRRHNGQYLVLVPKYTEAGNTIEPLLSETALRKLNTDPVEGFSLDLSAFI